MTVHNTMRIRETSRESTNAEPSTEAPSNVLPESLNALLDHVAELISDRILARLDEHAATTPPVLLGRAGLARVLQVSTPTIDRLRRSGCPTIWVANSPRFELASVLAFLRASKPNGSRVTRLTRAGIGGRAAR